MTFIEPDDLPSSAKIVAYCILSILSIICCTKSYTLGSTKSHYEEIPVVRYLFPFACLISAFENACLAAAALLIAGIDSNSKAINTLTMTIITVLFVLQAFIVPILLVVIFEVCYLVHKRRSVNFCGILFDRGQRIKIIGNRVRSFIMRNFMRMLGFILLAVTIMVNFDIVEEGEDDPMAGRLGWIGFVKDTRNFNEKYHLLFALLPSFILIICCLYLSIVLWKYGTNSSMVVHSSYLNPWFYFFFGTLFLIGGQLMNEDLYSITSNLGYICLYSSLILLMHEVDKDMKQADDFADFLKQIEICGNQCSVKTALPTVEILDDYLTEIRESVEIEHDPT